MRAIAVRRAQIEPFDPEAPADGYGLTERGRVQSRLLGARLAREGAPDVVYTGESDRHRATADVVVGTIEAVTGDRPPVEVDEGLDDVAWTLDALRTCYEERLTQRAWMRRWLAGELAIEESAETARERVRGLATRLVEAHPSDARLLLVTSAVPVVLCLCEAMGTTIEEIDLSIANAAVNAVEWGADQRALVAVNDAGHLPGALVTTDGFVERD